MMKIDVMRKFGIGVVVMFFLFLIQVATAGAWTKTMNFESGVTGSTGFDYAGSTTSQTSEQVNSGSKACKMVWTQGDVGWGTAHGELDYSSDGLGSASNEIWGRAYVYFKSPWSWSCSPVIKVFRLTQSSGGYCSIFADSGGNFVLSNEPGNVQPGTNTKFDIDKWQCIEIYVKLGNPGIIRIWKNGQLVIEDTTHNTGGTSSRALLMTQWNGNAPQNQTQYWDDMVITTDKPSAVDSKGNAMIGPIGWTGSGSSPTASVPAPTNMRVN